MVVGAVNRLTGLTNFKNAIVGEGRRRAAKLPPSADFAGPFTSP
jgi:hypothetical protein